MSNYSILKFEKEDGISNGAPKKNFVALVKKEGVEQPFRIQVENFSSAEEVLKEVNAWISQREREDALAIVESEKVKKEEREDSVLSELNSSLKQ